ncbi:MAG: hypothetical protein Q9174_007372, partial [Haloplaca sp. 1 TL-2023]
MDPTKDERNEPDLEDHDLSQKPIAANSFVTYFSTNIKTAHTDILMLLCCFISGLVDSTIYNAYGTFVSMQTGNTIFVGLGSSQGATNTKPYGWAKSLTSIACFFLGCVFWSRFSHLLGPRQRRTLVLSYLLQSLMMILVATLAQTGVVNGRLATMTSDIDWLQEIPVAILSFPAAGQLAGSRALNL